MEYKYSAQTDKDMLTTDEQEQAVSLIFTGDMEAVSAFVLGCLESRHDFQRLDLPLNAQRVLLYLYAQEYIEQHIKPLARQRINTN